MPILNLLGLMASESIAPRQEDRHMGGSNIYVDYTWLYQIIPYYTQLYPIILDYTWLYPIVSDYTNLYPNDEKNLKEHTKKAENG